MTALLVVERLGSAVGEADRVSGRRPGGPAGPPKPPATPVDDAMGRVRAWLAQPSAVVVEPTAQHDADFGRFRGVHWEMPGAA